MDKCFVQEEEDILLVGYIENNKLVKLNRVLDREGIFIGKVQRKMPNYKGYIVLLEEGKTGLLDQKYIIGSIKPGDEILLVLYKKTDDDKLDKYTMNFGIPGKFIVYYPYYKKISFSKKIPKEDKEILFQKAKENNMDSLVFRTSAFKVDFKEILEEYNNLKAVFEKILQESKFLPIPRRLFTSYKNVFSMLHGYKGKIVVNREELFKYLKKYLPEKNIKLDINYSFRYDEEITKDYLNLKTGIIPLDEGGDIIIEKTTALTTIDVNAQGNLDFLKVNKSAVKEALRAMEIMDITGIIIIDCITLSKVEREKLDFYVKNLVKDYSKVSYYGITKLGLLEFVKSGLAIDI